jgi:outer membrane protein OmpA-like peptidoglycan-associated protein
MSILYTAQKNIIAFLSCLLILAAQTTQAQQAQLTKAEKLYDRFAYAEAIPHFEEYLESADLADSLNAPIQIKLARSYKLTQQYPQSVRVFEQAISEQSEPSEIIDFASVLRINGRCEEAISWLRILEDRQLEDPRIVSGIRACEQESAQLEPYTIEAIPFNSSANECGPVFLPEGLMFSSARQEENDSKGVDAWTGGEYFDLFLGSLEEPDSAITRPNGELNGAFHDGPAAWDDESLKLFLTRSHRFKDGLGSQRGKSFVGLAIYESTQGENGWTEPKQVEFPNFDQICVHPAPSPGAKFMVFASTADSGYGGFDLYVSYRDGQLWSPPMNLGPRINGPGDELYPHIGLDSTLYFSSDGRIGLGGFDIYKAAFDGENWHHAEAMGKPINSAYDDFGLVWEGETQFGVMVSNRPGAAGGDDLYQIIRQETVSVIGWILDKDSIPIPNASVRVRSQEGEDFIIEANEAARFNLDMLAGGYYELSVDLEGFKPEKIVYQPLSQERSDEDPPTFVLEYLKIPLDGMVLQRTTGFPVGESSAELHNLDDGTSESIPVDSSGRFRAWLEPDKDYVLEADKEFYLGDPVDLNTDGMEPGESLDVLVEMSALSQDLVFDMADIYYDYGSFQINEKAERGLNRLYDFMLDYPNMRIELSSHTDSRSSDGFNLELSQKRADAVKEFMVGRGIESDRIEAVGYGETRPRNFCTNDIECSEELHQMNRRTEIKILHLDQIIESHEADASEFAQVEEPAFEGQAAASDSTAATWWQEGEAFAVQIGIDRSKTSNRFENLSWLGSIYVEESGYDFYRYVLGYYSTREEAEQIKAEARAAGIHDAFLVTYKDAVRVK